MNKVVHKNNEHAMGHHYLLYNPFPAVHNIFCLMSE